MAKSSNFSLISGRLGRRNYWITMGGLIAVRLGFVIASRVDHALVGKLSSTEFLLFMMAATMGKRLRDFGWSALWGWAAIGLFSFAVPFVLASLVAIQGDAGTNLSMPLPPWLQLVTAIPFYLVILILGIKKGDVGDNRFGPPVGRLSLPKASTEVSRVFD